jgi:hypothetical protein
MVDELLLVHVEEVGASTRSALGEAIDVGRGVAIRPA